MNVHFKTGDENPRNYLKIQPVPTDNIDAVREPLQARTDQFMSLTVPSRQQIRSENYKRRQMQLANEGFQSPRWKPLKELGHPVYLNNKQMIMESLGQSKLAISDSDRENELEMQRRASSIDAGHAKSKLLTMESMKTVKVKLAEFYKDMTNVLTQSEKISHTVRHGHSYFHVINQQSKQTRKLDKQKAQAEAHRRRTEIQPSAVYHSSESDEDELSNIVKIEQKKRKVTSRPYTPLHVNIVNLVIEKEAEVLQLPQPKRSPKYRLNQREDENVWNSLYRQLCALYWLLHAMTVDDILALPRITTSWNLVQGITVDNAKSRTLEINQSFEKFKNEPIRKIVPESTSLHNNLTAENSSVPTRKISEMPYQKFDSAHFINNSNSLRAAKELPRKHSAKSREVTYVPASRRMSKSRISELARRIEDDIKQEEKLEREEKFERSQNKAAFVAPANHLRPSSAVNIVDDSVHHRAARAQSATVKLSEQLDLQKRRDETELLKKEQETALKIKEKLEFLTKHRDETNVQKLRILSAQPRTQFHTAIRQIRQRVSYDAKVNRINSARKKEGEMLPWFLYLTAILQENISNYKISRVVQKIAEYGSINTPKFPSLKFTNVLETLSSWEICCPEVLCAIEFIREFIVEMSLDDFEDWFANNFPEISRKRFELDRNYRKLLKQRRGQNESEQQSMVNSSEQPEHNQKTRDELWMPPESIIRTPKIRPITS